MKKSFHFMGKGGVGKTTSAAVQATLLSQKGKTLIVSLDPAHNLGDVLGVEVKEEPVKVKENLYAAEPDVDKIIRSYIKSVTSDMERHYKYLKVYNLDKVFDVLEYTPGVEEQALLEALMKILNTEDYEYVVVDHAPTGLSVRVLLLPEILEEWLKKLIWLRKEIIKRRQVIGEKEEDEVLELLEEELEKNVRFKNLLKSPSSTSIILVLNPEEMPFLEAKRIKDALTKFGLPLCGVVVNKIIVGEHKDEILESLKREQSKWINNIEDEFKGYNVVKVPYLVPPPKGVERLKSVGERFWGGALCG